MQVVYEMPFERHVERTREYQFSVSFDSTGNPNRPTSKLRPIRARTGAANANNGHSTATAVARRSSLTFLTESVEQETQARIHVLWVVKYIYSCINSNLSAYQFYLRVKIEWYWTAPNGDPTVQRQSELYRDKHVPTANDRCGDHCFFFFFFFHNGSRVKFLRVFRSYSQG